MKYKYITNVDIFKTLNGSLGKLKFHWDNPTEPKNSNSKIHHPTDDLHLIYPKIVNKFGNSEQRLETEISPKTNFSYPNTFIWM